MSSLQDSHKQLKGSPYTRNRIILFLSYFCQTDCSFQPDEFLPEHLLRDYPDGRRLSSKHLSFKSQGPRDQWISPRATSSYGADAKQWNCPCQNRRIYKGQTIFRQFYNKPLRISLRLSVLTGENSIGNKIWKFVLKKLTSLLAF